MTETITVEQLRQRQAKAMPERELQEYVRKVCRDLGLFYYHTHRSQHSPAGFPDCVILTGDERMIVAELKNQIADPTPAQTEWLEAFRTAFEIAPDLFTVHVWRPMDALDGTIKRILTGETTT